MAPRLGRGLQPHSVGQVYPRRMRRNLALTVEREWYKAGAQQIVAGPAGDNDSTELEWELRGWNFRWELNDDGYRGPAIIPNQQQKPAEKEHSSHEHWFSSERRVQDSEGENGPEKFVWSERGPWRLNRRIRAAKFRRG